MSQTLGTVAVCQSDPFLPACPLQLVPLEVLTSNIATKSGAFRKGFGTRLHFEFQNA